MIIYQKYVKEALCRNWHFVSLAPPTVSECNTTIVVLTTNKTHYTITVLHVQNLYVEVNTGILSCNLSYTVQKQVMGGRVPETPFTLLHCTIKMF